MKIRTKFTISISLTALFTAMLFSIFVYSELIEEPHKLMKRELIDTGNAIVKSLSSGSDLSFSPSQTHYPLERYLVQITTEDNSVLYRSPLASLVSISRQPKDGFSTFTSNLDTSRIWLDPLEDDDHNEIKNTMVRFMLHQQTVKIADQNITVQLAKPLAMFSAELRELLHELLSFILLTVLITIILSYVIAGKLLEPLGSINKKIRSIRENSLDERIEPGKSQDELHALSLSLNSMFDRLDNSFKKQKEFISNASHEMKIPLTVAILGIEEMLSKDLPEDLQKEVYSSLYNLQRLNKLVKDLLDISHLEHSEFIAMKSISLNELIHGVLVDFDEMIQASGITCKSQLDNVHVSGDYDKLVRVFINLIDNAIKYNAPARGFLSLSAVREKKQVRITIENSGTIIPREDLPHIFEQFYRVEKSRSSHFGGTGLGLTIVKRIIELHGGTIRADSTENTTVITLVLPLG